MGTQSDREDRWRLYVLNNKHSQQLSIIAFALSSGVAVMLQKSCNANLILWVPNLRKF